MQDKPEGVRVVALKVVNFKRIEAFQAEIAAGLTLIAGPNGSGKSSVLDAIVAALGGKRSIPPRPVRDGVSEAEVVVDLDPYIVRRTFRAEGETALSVERKDGQAVPSPQTFLDSLCGRGEVFDPLSPLRERPERLAEILRGVAGLDFSELDNRRDHLFARRTEVGRSRKTTEGAARMAPHHPDAPPDPIDVRPLRDAQQAAFKQLQAHERARLRYRDVDSDICRTLHEVTVLEARLAEARKRLEEFSADRDHAKSELDKTPEPDFTGIASRIREAEDVNRKVAANRERQSRLDAAAEHAARYEELSLEIQEIDRQKADRLASARFPVEGLSIDEADRVLLDGVSIDQASSGQRIELGLALAAALRPGLRTLLVREGSLLDADALVRVRAWAETRDVSVLLEVVEDTPGEVPGAIEIRAGRLVDSVEAEEIDFGPRIPEHLPPPRAGRPARKGGSLLFPERGPS